MNLVKRLRTLADSQRLITLTAGVSVADLLDEAASEIERLMPVESNRLGATAVAVEFVPDGDKFRDDKDNDPRPSGTYLTVLLDDPEGAVVGGRVAVEFIK